MDFNFMVSGRTVYVKIRKLDGNLPNIAMTLSTKLGFHKIKIRQLLIEMIYRQTVKFSSYSIV